MASSDNRPAFRLPWQSGHATPSEGDASGATAVVDPPAWPSHDLARRQNQDATSSADAPTSADAPDSPAATQAHETAPADPAADVMPAQTTAAAAGPADTRSEMIETATPSVREAGTELRARKPTKFLADLARAMRQAADEARQSALAQLHAEVEAHTGAARTSCEQAAADAHHRADQDIATLGEWETEEIARIKRETEEGITARQSHLEAEVAGHATRLDAELALVQRKVLAFGVQMDAFFEGLLREEDPARFAAMAEQLPEPPSFAAWTPEQEHVPSPMAGESGTQTNDAAQSDEMESLDNHMPTPSDEPAVAQPGVDAGVPAMQAGDFAAAEAEAEAEAAQWTVTEEGAPDATATAEAEAPAAEAPAAEIEAAAAEAAVDGPWPPASITPAGPASTRTQVAVVGLVSVASIATFKRMLGRVEGVHAVQVASGPDGEFLFNVTHDQSLDMPAAVEGVQGFEVEIVGRGPGAISCHAVDPEVS